MFPATPIWTATCWRDGSSWTVHVPELHRTARAARLSQVEGVARDLVAASTHEDPASSRIVVDLIVRHSLTELVEAAAAVREDPDRVSVEAVTLRRGLARRLAQEGLDVRDVASLLGLSYGRALALVADLPAPRRPYPSDEAPPGTPPPAPGPEGRDADRCPRPHTSYRHEAVFYRGPQDFLASTLPFVREALELGQAVMVALVPERLELLRTALGPAGDAVGWVDMTQLGGNPARIIPAWRQFVQEHDGQAVRGIGEPVWAGRRPDELLECQLHEALLNTAIGPDTPLWLRCPYDADALPVDVLEEATRSHPALVEGDDYRGSTRYAGSAHVADLFAQPLPEPAVCEEMAFDEGSLDLVRGMVRSRATEAGWSATRTADLVLAVAEASLNSVRHAGGHGRLRVWREAGDLVCEVRDGGVIDDPLVGRLMPGPHEPGGRGLWLVNQLSDLAQVRSSAQGTTVRVVSRR